MKAIFRSLCKENSVTRIKGFEDLIMQLVEDAESGNTFVPGSPCADPESVCPTPNREESITFEAQMEKRLEILKDHLVDEKPDFELRSFKVKSTDSAIVLNNHFFNV